MDYDLCDNCRKLAECFLKEVIEKDKCEEFEPLALEEMLDRLQPQQVLVVVQFLY